MARRISMLELRDILLRLRKNQSIKSIRRELGRHKTVIRHMRDIAKKLNWLNPESPLPSEEEIHKAYCEEIIGIKKFHPLDTFKNRIEGWLKDDYSYVVMHKLISEQLPCSETTIRRYVHRNFDTPPHPVMVRSYIPGEVMEVDFGYIGVCFDYYTGRRRKTYFFSARLRYSRKTYREVVFDQKEKTFFFCHIHAFEHFGGVPKKIVPDNLKAAIIKASFYEPLVNRTYRNLAEHYGFMISPTLPATPKHKGGVENDVKYVKRNFLPIFKEQQKQKGKEVMDASDLARELQKWNDETANLREIQKVGRTPLELFEEERGHLQPLADKRWDVLTCKMAMVGRDWRIQFEKGFYSVPYRYIGKEVLALGNSHTVRIMYNHEEITMHERVKRDWEYKRKSEHAPPHQEEYLQSNSKGLRYMAEKVGPATLKVVEEIFSERAIDGLRPVRGLLRLGSIYSAGRLEAACKRALDYETATYRSVKLILEKGLDKCKEDNTEDSHGCYQFKFQRGYGYFDAEKSPNGKSVNDERR